MTLLLLFGVLLQVQENIPRAEKKLYLSAAKDCDRAKTLTKTSPQEAVDLLTLILENRAIQKRECILRIVLLPGTYSEPYSFFPYQYRGQAQVQLALKAEEKEEQIALLKLAVKDFEESIQRGLPSSKPLLKNTEAKLAELTKPQPENPPRPTFSESDFRPEWEELMKQKNFTGALEYINKDSELPKELRASYLSETRTRSRQTTSESVQAFQNNLEKNHELNQIRKMNRFVFDQNFSLPTEETLIAPSAAYFWSLSVRSTLLKYREGAEILKDLLRLAIESIPLSEKSNHPRFLAMEHFAQGILKARLHSIESAARKALHPEREKQKKEVVLLEKKWQSFEKRVKEACTDRTHSLDRLARPNFNIPFPIEWNGKEQVTSNIIASGREKDPEAALGRISRELTRTQKAKILWSVESKQSMIHLQIIIGALLGELGGKPLPDIVQELQSHSQQLKDLQGELKEDRFGPKVGRVFEALRKS